MRGELKLFPYRQQMYQQIIYKDKTKRIDYAKYGCNELESDS